ncbi:hypothetical protein [Flavobacterium sp. HNIBRBA15423]|uniref:hypothetical protein n=1 Tax=Flavobacterium sp. HNIBRBA15423 TaxID=3458683 RepID=UPI004043AF0C
MRRNRYRKKYRIVNFWIVNDIHRGTTQFFYKNKLGDTRNLTQTRFDEALKNADSMVKTRWQTPLERIIKYRLKFLIN